MTTIMTSATNFPRMFVMLTTVTLSADGSLQHQLLDANTSHICLNIYSHPQLSQCHHHPQVIPSPQRQCCLEPQCLNAHVSVPAPSPAVSMPASVPDASTTPSRLNVHAIHLPVVCNIPRWQHQHKPSSSSTPSASRDTQPLNTGTIV